MRTGISMIFRNKLPPLAMSKRELLGFFDCSAELEACAALGIKHFELPADLNLLWDEAFSQGYIARLGGLQRRFGFTCSIHLPFRGIDLSYPSKQLAQGHADMFAQLIRATAPLSPKAYVVHASGPFLKAFRDQSVQDAIPGRCLELLEYCLCLMAEKAAIPVELLALENLALPLRFNDALLDRRNFSVCLDAGHLFSNKGGDDWSTGRFIQQYGRRMIAVHLHDVILREGMAPLDHQKLGSGELDYHQLARQLFESGYEGYVTAEIKSSMEDACRSARKFEQAVSALTP
ncbi:MAG TPA: sugar phosphate isomerase/epimerase family protein [Clostridia bacterium]|nr:sugar phosphate isomerase/epimerase family protein [Clostridia bacterium]